MNKIATCITAISFLVAGCMHPEHPVSLNPNDRTETVSIPLNKGEKWKVDDQMKAILEESRQYLEHYNSNDSNKDDLKLAEDLEKLNTQFIKSCTMKGAAHDALHQWLEPHIRLIRSLKSATHPTDAKEIRQQLARSFQDFDTYFH